MNKIFNSSMPFKNNEWDNEMLLEKWRDLFDSPGQEPFITLEIAKMLQFLVTYIETMINLDPSKQNVISRLETLIFPGAVRIIRILRGSEHKLMKNKNKRENGLRRFICPQGSIKFYEEMGKEISKNIKKIEIEENKCMNKIDYEAEFLADFCEEYSLDLYHST